MGRGLEKYTEEGAAYTGGIFGHYSLYGFISETVTKKFLRNEVG